MKGSLSNPPEWLSLMVDIRIMGKVLEFHLVTTFKIILYAIGKYPRQIVVILFHGKSVVDLPSCKLVIVGMVYQTGHFCITFVKSL